MRLKSGLQTNYGRHHELVGRYRESAAAQLPPLRHIRRCIRRAKKDAGNPIPVPQNRQIMEIPEEYAVTHRAEPLFLH